MNDIQLFRLLMMFGTLGLWYLGVQYYSRKLKQLREKAKRDMQQLWEESQ